MIQKNRFFLLLLLPTVVLLVIFIAIPVAQSVYLSFHRADQRSPPTG
jgi:ABC-type sugar transport system permease subunit